MKTWKQFIKILAIITFLFNFSTCDFLNDNENPSGNDNPPGDNFVYKVGTTLLQTQWGRGNQFPYNMMTPTDNDGNPTFVGCVAIATAQIMGYHSHPARGSGFSESYLSAKLNKQMPSVNLNVDYDWSNMLNTYRSDRSDSNQRQQNAIATLMYHVGVSIKMNYGIGGAMGGSGADSIKAAQALVNHFGYDRSIQRHLGTYYDAASWGDLIKAQIDAGYPVYHSSGGHARNLDGYDNTGRFHINNGMGIYSKSNLRWAYLDELQPEENGAEEEGETVANNGAVNGAVMINIKPDQGSTGSNVFGLNSFTASNTSVSQNELFTVTLSLRSFGFFPGGQAGVVLVNNAGHIVQVVGIRNWSAFIPNATWTSNPINCYITEIVNTGNYHLQIATRVEGGEWKIVTLSDISKGIPKSLPITVNPGEKNGGGYGRALTNFTAPSSVSRGVQFTVSVSIMADPHDVFPGGQLAVALVDNDNKITVIGSSRDIGSGSGTLTMNRTVPNTVTIGSYKLRIVIRPTISEGVFGDWRIATMFANNVPTSIDFEVE